MTAEIEAIAAFTDRLAREAGQIIARARQENNFSRSMKAGAELVTSADLAADQLICERINEHFPDHAILSEESSPDFDYESFEAPLWVIDPIDGTVNFAHGHHMVAVSIAFVDRGEAQVGVVHAPFLDETFLGIRNQGAWCNEQALRASDCQDLSAALIATGFPYRRDQSGQLKTRIGRVIDHCRDVRRLGSAALDICWVACGRLDGYYENVSPWDMAAARLIALEAGANCGHLHPLPADRRPDLHAQDLLITAPGIHAALGALLREA